MSVHYIGERKNTQASQISIIVQNLLHFDGKKEKQIMPGL